MTGLTGWCAASGARQHAPCRRPESCPCACHQNVENQALLSGIVGARDLCQTPLSARMTSAPEGAGNTNSGARPAPPVEGKCQP